jgi:hypothetical protein
LLRCICRLLALNGGSLGRTNSVAIAGIADIRRSLAARPSDANDPERSIAEPKSATQHDSFRRRSGIDNHGALTICLHAGGNPASVKTGLGLLGGGCSVDSLNQRSSSLPQPSRGSGGTGGLHSALSAGQAIWT